MKCKMIWVKVPVKERKAVLKALEKGLPRMISQSFYCSSAFASFTYNNINYQIEECFEKIVRFEKKVMKKLPNKQLENLLSKWRKEVKDEEDEIIFDCAAWIDPLPRRMEIDRLKQCIKDLEKIKKSI